jgi:hypothetical protein
MMVSLMISESAIAVPAYARQVGMECSSCHFQHYPKLNAFGRAFKANGYSMTNQDLLEGDDLSLPPNLNASFFIKSRITEAEKIGTGTKAEWQVPDEAALLIGGRLAEGVGGFIEMSDDILSYKISLTRKLDSGMTYGSTLYATDGLGAAFGFELMATGAVRNNRPFERASKSNLGNLSFDLSGASTGIVLHAADTDWFVALTAFAPDSAVADETEINTGDHMSNYFRAAYMPEIAGMDAGFGVGYFAGKTGVTTKLVGAGVDVYGNVPGDYDIETNAWFIDAQLQGEVGGKELGVYFMYAEGDDEASAGTRVNLYNNGFADAPSGWGLDAEYNMTPALHLLGTVSQHDSGDPAKDAVNAYGVGLYWLMAQNLSLQTMYEDFDGDDPVTGTSQTDRDYRWTVQLETAF